MHQNGRVERAPELLVTEVYRFVNKLDGGWRLRRAVSAKIPQNASVVKAMSSACSGLTPGSVSRVTHLRLACRIARLQDARWRRPGIGRVLRGNRRCAVGTVARTCRIWSSSFWRRGQPACVMIVRVALQLNPALLVSIVTRCSA